MNFIYRMSKRALLDSTIMSRGYIQPDHRPAGPDDFMQRLMNIWSKARIKRGRRPAFTMPEGVEIAA